MTATHRVVGRPLPRLDGHLRVTGHLRYAADLVAPAMLHGALVRSPHAHARIVRIETGAASRVPGGCTIITGKDIPAVRFGALVRDESVLAVDRVRYVGQPVAAVAAATPEMAEEAARLVEVEYEPLPAVLDPEQAVHSEAALVHEDWRDYAASPVIERSGNVCGRTTIARGDVARGFAEADHVFEHTFETASVHQAYLEPRAALAWVEPGGQVVVQSNTQVPYDTQALLADVLGIPPTKIRVICAGIGGGFGGKLRLGVEHYAVLLAQATGRPVRIVLTMAEEMIDARPRHPTRIVLRTGVTRDGIITARQGRVILDTGAFAGSGPALASVATLMLAGPYRVPNLRIEALAVYTHKQNFGSYRAPMGPQAVFAVESQMDIIADHLGMDPLHLRLRNVVQDGDLGPTGQPLGRVGVRDALLRAAQAIGWEERRSGPFRGKGLACSWWTTTGGSSGCFAKINADGTVTLLTGAVEIGTGALTGAAQVLAEELGVKASDVTIISADTHGTPYDYGAQGSRTAFSVGNAARSAAQELKRQLLHLAAQLLEARPEDLEVREAHVAVKGVPSRTVALAELARVSLQKSGGLVAHGTFIAPPTPYDASCVTGHLYPAFHSPSFHAHAAEVEVDPETGQVRVLRYVVAQDVGFAINPAGIEGQIEGGVAQGLGQALTEQLIYDGGQVLTHNLTDYALPTTLDVPNVESIILEYPSEVGPYGAKGAGEPPIIGPPAAIGNALYSAVGVRLTTLPMTPENVLRALKRG
ncbi:MAG: xanthine dehydrogenase family protein molybdopterin-binding subunit [Armatimonadetes bacterium]|nr:xanthine dehydrogenase family protein molybdopterin-binding subunit [Armatimonadota bacterium]